MDNRFSKRSSSVVIEQKNAENSIERLNNFKSIGFQAKIIVLLTYKNLKPVGEFTWVVNSKELEDIKKKQENNKEVKEMKEILSDLGLVNRLSEGKWDEYDEFNFRFSLKQEVLEQFEKVCSDKSIPTVIKNKKVAEFFGFPQTAIDAWSSKDGLLDDIPEGEIEPEIRKLIKALGLFKFSKAHWKEELDVYRKYAEAIKDVDPETWSMVQHNF